MSELKVNKISPSSGTAFTLGDSGDTFTVPSGVTLTVAGTLTQTGAQTFDGGVEIDNFTINGTEIDLSSGDLTVDVAGDITLDADGGDLKFADGGTDVLGISNSSSDVVIKPLVDAKDIIFQQYDGTEVARIEDNATFNVSSAGKFAYAGTAVTATAGELNLLDGGTSVGGSITLADADGVVVNDGGTMKTIPASDIKTYAGFGVGDITGATALTDIPATTDELVISDGGTLKRLDYSLIVPFAGAQVYSTGTQSNISANSDVSVAFDAEIYDTDSFHDNSTNNSRFTIPSKFNGFKAILRGHVTFEDVSDGGQYELRFFKNGAANQDGAQLMQAHRAGSATGNKAVSGASMPITLATNDYFELVVSTNESDVDISNGANGNNEVYFGGFSITIIPGSGA